MPSQWTVGDYIAAAAQTASCCRQRAYEFGFGSTVSWGPPTPVVEGSVGIGAGLSLGFGYDEVPSSGNCRNKWNLYASLCVTASLSVSLFPEELVTGGFSVSTSYSVGSYEQFSNIEGWAYTLGVGGCFGFCLSGGSIYNWGPNWFAPISENAGGDKIGYYLEAGLDAEISIGVDMAGCRAWPFFSSNSEHAVTCSSTQWAWYNTLR